MFRFQKQKYRGMKFAGKIRRTRKIHEKEEYPQVRIQLYRYDGKDCIAVVDGEPIALVERAYVIDFLNP